ncbi:hypothetical protein [Cupriavidus yeoncheonensis]|uniref:hypothetical protein n=1 Tax=Cupriavidus yeoncheonensis TaxID=1462994 RepID=UPI001BADE970|nr:hypothetical protein [Cupriavidus yeoncheonensis]
MNGSAMGSVENRLDLLNGMRIAALTTVGDDSRTRLLSGLAPRHATPWVRTIGASVIAALPFTGIANPRFSAHGGPGQGTSKALKKQK